MKNLVGIILLVGMLGCDTSDAIGEKISCSPSGDCLDGYTCIENQCVAVGGGEAAQMCQAVETECGGDIVGAWELVGECQEYEYQAPDSCPETELLRRDEVTTLDFEFQQDGTFRTESSEAITASLRVPQSCLALDDTCQSAQPDVFDTVQAEVECKTDGEDCLCLASYSRTADIGMGRWEHQGSNVAIYFEGEPADVAAYCVDGSYLKLSVPSADLEILFSKKR